MDAREGPVTGRHRSGGPGRRNRKLGASPAVDLLRARRLRDHRLPQRQALARRRAGQPLRRAPADVDLDVVVVDNGSDGAAAYVEERFPGVRTIRCDNRGFGHANNRGLETANARYVLFLNPDTEFAQR